MEARVKDSRTSATWNGACGRGRAFVGGCALWLLLGGVAQAQPLDSVSRDAAGALAVAGLEAYEAGSYAEALDKLEKSYAVARVPTLGLWSARALRKVGRWRDAEDRYREAVALPMPEAGGEIQANARASAQSELAELSPMIPRLAIEIEGAPRTAVELRIDGKPASSSEHIQRLDPGPHRIEALRGQTRQNQDLSLNAGEDRSILLRFRPEPVAAPARVHNSGSGWLRSSGWAALAVGGAGAVLGTVSCILAVQKKQAIDSNPSCHDNHCAATQSDLVDSYTARRTLASAGLIVGGAFAALGTTALLIAGSEPEDPRAEAVVSASFAGVRGSF